MSIHHADLFLKNKNIKYIHYPFDISEYDDYTVTGIAIDNLHKDGFMIVDRTDDHHPAIESNRLTCENIFRILNAK
jgi:hypothetical protein